MPSDKLQQICIKLEVDIADMSKKEAEQLFESISDYLVKYYNIINCDYKVIDGE